MGWPTSPEDEASPPRRHPTCGSLGACGCSWIIPFSPKCTGRHQPWWLLLNLPGGGWDGRQCSVGFRGGVNPGVEGPELSTPQAGTGAAPKRWRPPEQSVVWLISRQPGCPSLPHHPSLLLQPHCPAMDSKSWSRSETPVKGSGGGQAVAMVRHWPHVHPADAQAMGGVRGVPGGAHPEPSTDPGGVPCRGNRGGEAWWLRQWDAGLLPRHRGVLGWGCPGVGHGSWPPALNRCQRLLPRRDFVKQGAGFLTAS